MFPLTSMTPPLFPRYHAALLLNPSPSFPEQGSLQSYSSKMMKSIWGEYNRYSVHNFKSSQSSGPSAGAGQNSASAQRAQNSQGSGLFQ